MPGAAPSSPERLPGLTVDVAALRRKGTVHHQLAVELPVDWLRTVLGDTDADPGDPGHVQMEIFLPTDGAVIARGRLNLAFEVPCGRCLDPAAVDGSTDLQASYVRGTELPLPSGRAGETEGEEGLGLTDEDLDTWTYDGTTLQLDALVIEHVKLAYPMRALCSRGEACQGLCSNCGADLNATPAVGRRCPSCGAEVAPVAGDPAPPEEGPLAEALRKLQLPD